MVLLRAIKVLVLSAVATVFSIILFAFPLFALTPFPEMISVFVVGRFAGTKVQGVSIGILVFLAELCFPIYTG